MRLRNKKTGEIGYLTAGRGIDYCVVANDEWNSRGRYKSLAELSVDWEDTPEEPKEFWFIDDEGGVERGVIEFEENLNLMKQIGNYFESREEAEKAVERLRAWKRLKDKGIEFYGWRKNSTGTYDFLARWKDVPPKMTDIIKDLDLLFGGEE